MGSESENTAKNAERQEQAKKFPICLLFFELAAHLAYDTFADRSSDCEIF